MGFGLLAYDGSNPPQQHTQERQRVDAEIVERAVAVDGLVALLERRVGIREEILVHLQAHMIDGADGPFVEVRIAPIVESAEVTEREPAGTPVFTVAF